MVLDNMRELELVELLDRATTRLLTTVDALAPEQVKADSLLPGWSRGHLLTHLAGNAEGLTRLILGAATGHALAMYASLDNRNGDIETGALREPSVIVAHLHLATATLDAAVSSISDWTAPVVFSTVSGPTEKPLTEVLSMRLREVAIHHVDLGAGHDFESEDEEVLDELIANAIQRISAHSDARIDLVDLPAPAMLGWLTGRSAARPDLPKLPAWG